MKAIRMLRGLFRLCLAGAGLHLAGTALYGQRANGIIQGRVLNPEKGQYLESVRVTVEGTNLETLTDATGHYQISAVPVGTVTLKAFRTGLVTETQSVNVPAGQVVEQNFSMKALAGSEAAVQMGAMTVTAPKEMEGAAIAINTQRFAPNQMAAIASDELGPIPLQNVGQVLQTLPNITMTQGGMGEPNTISIEGVPEANVPVTFNGFNFAGAGASTARTVGVHQVSLNNISRVEVSFTPTPETPGSALAGTVNMVPKSAFERAKPVYTATASLLMRDTDLTLGKTPGGRRGPVRKIKPAFDFSAIVPLNDHIGFTLTAATSPMYTPLAFLQATRRGTSAPTNGGAFPDTTPDKPYLTTFAVRDAVRFTRHTAYAATVDYRFSPRDTMTFTINYALFDWQSNDRQMTFTINRVLPGDFSTTFTHSAPGGGTLQQFDAAQDVYDTQYMPTFIYRHRGPIWSMETGAALSHARRFRRDLSHNTFANAIANRPNVTIFFDNIRHDGPGNITVTDAAGIPVDPFRASSYSLVQATGNEINAFDVQRSAYANVSRPLSLSVPVTIKAGVDVRQQTKDIRVDPPVFPFVGANKSADQVLDVNYSQRNAPFWYDQIDWVSSLQLYDLYRAHPEYFGAPNEAARHNSATAQSRFAKETVSSVYFRADGSLLEGRLKLVGGVRAEQTNVEGEGDLIDTTRIFRRDASGKVVLGTNGQPLQTTTDPTQIALLTHIDRGLIAKKEYLRFFPSINATFNVRENLIARAGYYRSIGRPDFNQYGGSLTLPNTENPPGPTNVISVNNAAIKPWRADTVRLGLEFYFQRVGLLSVSGFRRQFTNFFGPTVAQSSPEFLSHYGLDAATYGSYSVSTQQNVPGTVLMTGFNFDYKQALTFLPNWARGVQVVASFTEQRATGTGASNLAGFIPRFGSWSVSLSRPKYTLRASWVYRARTRQGVVAPGGSIAPETYFWGERRLQTNLSAEYNLTKLFTVFATFTNLNNAPIDTEVYGPSTPQNAEFSGRLQYGAQWLFGLRARF